MKTTSAVSVPCHVHSAPNAIAESSLPALVPVTTTASPVACIEGGSNVLASAISTPSVAA